MIRSIVKAVYFHIIWWKSYYAYSGSFASSAISYNCVLPPCTFSLSLSRYSDQEIFPTPKCGQIVPYMFHPTTYYSPLSLVRPFWDTCSLFITWVLVYGKYVTWNSDVCVLVFSSNILCIFVVLLLFIIKCMHMYICALYKSLPILINFLLSALRWPCLYLFGSSE